VRLPVVSHLFTAPALCTGLAGLSCPAAETETGFKSMFNGKELTGWEGKPEWWRVEDGALTSDSTPEKPCPSAHYLM